MALNIAPNYTHVAASQTDSVIVTSESCTVFGISAGGTANGRILVEEAGTTTVILELDVLANTAVVFNIPFVAARGLQITTPASVTCTVFHSNAT